MLPSRSQMLSRVILLLCCMALATTAQAVVKPHVRFCYICQAQSLCQQALYGVPYYAAQFDAIDWSIQLVGKNGNRGTNNIVDGVIEGGEHCDIFLGPGQSVASIALATIVTKPWIDFASTSTELSDKSAHPYFSRVIPTDDVGARGILAIMDKYDWKSAYLLCSDEPYGRSLATAMERGITERGGTSKSVCVPSDANAAAMQVAAREIRDSRYRVIAVLMAGWVDAFVNLLAEIEAYKMNTTNVFIFGESICSGWGSLPHAVHGSFCVSYGYDFSKFMAFYETVKRKDPTLFKSEVERIGLEFSVLRNASDVTYQAYVYDAFSNDAFLHPMSVLHQAQLAGEFSPTDVWSTIDLLRNRTSAGFSGTITLDASGDRPFTLMDLASVTPEGIKQFGTWTIEQGFYHNTSMLREIYVPLEGMPDFVVENEAFTLSASAKLTIAIVIPLALVLIVAVVLIVLMFLATNTTRHAPKDDSKPFAILTLDMQKSTALWDRHPAAMAEVIKVYNTVIRRVIRAFPVFEVNTQGDSYTVVSKSPDALVDVAIQIQQDLYRTHWPGNGAVDDYYRTYAEDVQVPMKDYPDTASELSTASANSGRHSSAYANLWNGPRVRCVVNHGRGIISQASGSLEYTGVVMDQCREVEALTHGGQVVISEAAVKNSSAWERLGLRHFAKVTFDDGLESELFSVTISGLEGRVFLPRQVTAKTPVAVAVTPTTLASANPLMHRSLSANAHSPEQSPTSPSPPLQHIEPESTGVFQESPRVQSIDPTEV